VTINVTGTDYELTPEMLAFEQVKKKINGQNIIPAVIEPSFGIGRIIYAVLEHSYLVRAGDEQRGFLRLPPVIAPVKCSILPLMPNDKLMPFVSEIAALLTQGGIASKVDTLQSIGRRYARTDEIGVPFGVTIDYTTVEDKTVTLRERDSMEQVRVKIEELGQLIQALVEGRTTWTEVLQKHPLLAKKEEE